MKRAEREQLIEHYLSGKMTSSEEQDFFIEVAADRELRTELKAYQVVDQAVRKDREADLTSYAELRSHMLGVLAAASPHGVESVKEAPVQGSAASSAPVAGATVPTGSTFMRLLMTAGAGLIVASSVVLVMTKGDGMEGGRISPPATGRTVDTMLHMPDNTMPGPGVPEAELSEGMPDSGTTRDMNLAGGARARKAEPRREASVSLGGRGTVGNDDAAGSSSDLILREGTVPRTRPSDSSKGDKPFKLNIQIDEPRNSK